MLAIREMLELVLMPTKGCHVLRIELGGKNKKEDNGLHYLRGTRGMKSHHLGDCLSLELS